MTSVRRMLAAVLCLAAAGSVAVACSGTDAVSQDVKGALGYQAGDSALTWVPRADRVPVSGVHGDLLDGRPFDLAAWKGDVVVVNFWGSWCGPCQQETRALEQVHRDTADRGVRFLGIDVREDVSAAGTFVREHHVTYPSISDPSNLLALRFHGVPPNATPSTIVLDRDGRIAARHSGPILYTQLRALVDRVRRESP